MGKTTELANEFDAGGVREKNVNWLDSDVIC